MPSTMKDIAKRTGLGLATISKYLNGGSVRAKNKKLIDEAVKELHFVPNEFARSLKTSQSRTIGVVIPDFRNAFSTSVIATMEDYLRKKDYAVIVCDCRFDPQREKEAVSFLIHKRVDGLINMPTDPTGAHLSLALENNTPVVLLDRMIRSLSGQVSAVVIDNVAAAEEATLHMLDAGHTDIGLILGNQGIYTTENRFWGYQNAYQQRGLTPREELIQYSDYTMEGGYAAVKKLLSLKKPPTAMLVTNFDMTLGTMIALNEANIHVPEDLSLITFDKLDLFGSVYSYLTLVKQPQEVIGECVAKQMLNLLTEENIPHQVTMLSSEFKEGSSVRKIK
ncbi:MAG: LacI family DNA-binding transcriptional regulator [Eubacteriales bacterium]|nr:LacI family DNA-binding transcriptional regulator [Eubacteriales bacterium]